MNKNTAFGVVAAWFAFVVAMLGAYVTHVVWAISTLLSDIGPSVAQGVLMATGVILAPVGAVHGVMIWFGSGF